jgi:flagellar assembly protein FliH
MSTIIRASDHSQCASSVPFNFDDMAAQARQYLDKVRAEALKIVAQANQDAVAIRQRAEQEGRQAATAAAAAVATTAAQQTLQSQLNTLMPALRQAVIDIQQAKQGWIAHWESCGIHVAAAIAQRLVRQELSRKPEIPLTLVREALELAAGTPQIQVHLNPADYASLENQVQAIVCEMAGMGDAALIADAAITPGGCRVETRFGTIDQQFEAQLARIEEELKQ